MSMISEYVSKIKAEEEKPRPEREDYDLYL